MAFSAKLADLFVQFVASGVEQLSSAFDRVHSQLEKTQQASQQVGGLITSAFGKATLAVTGFGTAAVYASSMGDILTLKISLLSREIGGIFLPIAQQFGAAIDRITGWFRSLSGAQQDSIAKWVAAAAAMLAVSTIMPRLIGFIAQAVAVVKTLTVAVIGLLSGTGIGALLPLIGALTTAFMALTVGGVVATDGIGGLLKAVQPLIDAIGQAFNELSPFIDAIAVQLAAAFKAVAPALGELIVALGKMFAALAPLVPILAEALVPLIKGLAEAISFLTSLINENTLKWIAAAGAFLLVVTIVPRVISAITSVINALRALTVAQIIQKAFSGPAGWAQLAIGAGVAAAAIGAAAVAYNTANSAIAKNMELTKGVKFSEKTGGAHRTATPHFGGFEAIEAAWTRIAQASVMVGTNNRTPEQELVEVAKQQLGEQQATNRKLDTLKPPMK